MEYINPLHDIRHYSPTLTIAQVLKFCERKSLPITRPMIQNYIRDGLLPPPAGRIYTHKHLAALAVISRLKSVFDMPAIKKALTPHMDTEGLPLEKYEQLMDVADTARAAWHEHVTPILSRGATTQTPAAMLCLAGLCAAIIQTYN